MTKTALLGAVALVASVLAGPAMAQQAISHPGHCAQFHPDANCDNLGPGNPYTGNDQRPMAYRNDGNWDNSYNRWDGNQWSNRDSGFWPGDVAAGIAGAAVGTVAAIATAPIGGDAYARANGFVCTPGTWFRGEDGRRHICQ